MKKPMVDYREFRLSRLNDPRFSHLKLLLGWVGYFVLYFLTENLIPAEKCTPVHMCLMVHTPSSFQKRESTVSRPGSVFPQDM